MPAQINFLDHAPPFPKSLDPPLKTTLILLQQLLSHMRMGGGQAEMWEWCEIGGREVWEGSKLRDIVFVQTHKSFILLVMVNEKITFFSWVPNMFYFTSKTQ